MHFFFQSSSTISIPTPTGNVEDLFSAHDFDIQIDLPAGPEGMYSMYKNNASMYLVSPNLTQPLNTSYFYVIVDYTLSHTHTHTHTHFPVSFIITTHAHTVSTNIRSVPKSAPVEKGDGPKRSLNLSDYKKRRGLI